VKLKEEKVFDSISKSLENKIFKLKKRKIIFF
jgi:hypothetical protein